MKISMSNLQDSIGMKFNSLTVLSIVEKPNKTKKYLLCRCDCGREVVVRADHVIKLETHTCGCQNGKRNPIEHNLSRTRLYEIWGTMKHRCYHPTCEKYAIYGARGIRMCDEWKNDFMSFREWALNNGYADNLTIDRIDNDKGYCPDNCRWITLKEQARNRRDTIFIEYNNEVRSLAEWCEILNLPYHGIRQRARLWKTRDGKRLFETPLKKDRRRK